MGRHVQNFGWPPVMVYTGLDGLSEGEEWSRRFSTARWSSLACLLVLRGHGRPSPTNQVCEAGLEKSYFFINAI